MNNVDTRPLWDAFRSKDSREAREELIKKYIHLVSITAGRLYGPLPPGQERDDLMGAGVVGLVKAVDQFDPDRGIKFETYAITLIRGAILEMLRGDDWVPRLVREQQKLLRQAYQRLEQEHGRPPTEQEVADALGVDLERLDKMLTDIGRSSLLSLDDLRPGSGDERVADRIPTNDASAFERVALKDRQHAMAGAVDRLPERERLVIALYYHEGLTFREIGSALGVSESRAYQLHAQAVTRMRGYLKPDAELFPGGAGTG